MSSVLSELGSLHARFVHGRRTRALSEHLAPLLPAHANVLDVGCGDGLVASRIGVLRPDVTLVGLDISLRPVTHIPVSLFDGQHLPVEDGSFDAVMLVDVLHHTDDPIALLREAGRASAGIVLVKDHTLDGFLAGVRLRVMDWFGNAHHGVPLPYCYWPRHRWLEAFDELGWVVEIWKDALGLYAWAGRWLFDNGLHFVARLKVR